MYFYLFFAKLRPKLYILIHCIFSILEILLQALSLPTQVFHTPLSKTHLGFHFAAAGKREVILRRRYNSHFDVVYGMVKSKSVR